MTKHNDKPPKNDKGLYVLNNINILSVDFPSPRFPRLTFSYKTPNSPVTTTKKTEDFATIVAATPAINPANPISLQTDVVPGFAHWIYARNGIADTLTAREGHLFRGGIADYGTFAGPPFDSGGHGAITYAHNIADKEAVFDKAYVIVDIPANCAVVQ